MASKLAQIKFEDGNLGFQETDDDGNLIALYDHDGDQFARMADADSHGAPSRRKWELLRDLGQFNDSDDFWDLVASTEAAK